MVALSCQADVTGGSQHLTPAVDASRLVGPRGSAAVDGSGRPVTAAPSSKGTRLTKPSSPPMWCVGLSTPSPGRWSVAFAADAVAVGVEVEGVWGADLDGAGDVPGAVAGTAGAVVGGGGGVEAGARVGGVAARCGRRRRRWRRELGGRRGWEGLGDQQGDGGRGGYPGPDPAGLGDDGAGGDAVVVDDAETVVGMGAGWAAMPVGSLQPRATNPRATRAAGRNRRRRRDGRRSSGSVERTGITAPPCRKRQVLTSGVGAGGSIRVRGGRGLGPTRRGGREGPRRPGRGTGRARPRRGWT
jgi:hypothetical protein